MNVLDLFSGIGGFSLGLERAGMRTVAFCEIDPFCRRVLAKHWPGVPIFHDVRELSARDVRPVDVICGGFPCQDISHAGSRAGIEGARSGLWSEYARLIGDLRPLYVVVENVAALLDRGLDVVLGDLAALGYDAEWHCIRAADVGAPHLRDRIWIIAYPQHSDTDCERPHRANLHQHRSSEFRNEQIRISRPLGEALADASSARLQGSRNVARAPSSQAARQSMFGSAFDGRQWLAEPDVGRVAHGVPSRVDRIRALGNAVIPQIPEIIGRAIMTVHSSGEDRNGR